MNKSTQGYSSFKKFFYGLMTAILLIAVPLPVFALEDGAYTVSRSTSYANPETGNTVDGGTNIALGDSMAESIIEKQILVEQTKEKTYVTIGIGLMSNISNVKIQTMGKDGTFRNVNIKKTGSHQLSGDTCNHYRFEMNSASDYISPIIFVEPMGRDVQFFVKLNMNSAKSGTGVFKSEMIPVEKPTESSEDETKKPTESSKEKSSNNDSPSQETKAQPKETEDVTRKGKVQPEETKRVEKEESPSEETESITEETKPEETETETSEEVTKASPEEAETTKEETKGESQADTGYMIAGIIAAVLIVSGITAVIIYQRRKDKS